MTYEHRSLKTKQLWACSLDPIWTLKAKLWRTDVGLDPAWTLVSTLVIPLLPRARARSRPHLKNSDQNMLLRQDFKIAV
jgi:hypothetical protein